MRVWLFRYVTVGGHGEGWFRRAVELPFPPFPGLGLFLHELTDPEPVEQVFINPYGSVVVQMPTQRYTDADFNTEEEAKSQFAWETRDWIESDGLESYRVKPPTDGEMMPITMPERATLRDLTPA